MSQIHLIDGEKVWFGKELFCESFSLLPQSQKTEFLLSQSHLIDDEKQRENYVTKSLC